MTGTVWHGYFNPETPLTEETVRRTGLSPEFLADKPTFAEMAAELHAYIGTAEAVLFGDYLPVHALGFELARCGLGTPLSNIVDLQHRANTLQPGAATNLEAVCQRFFVNTDQRGYPSNALHRAAIIASLAIKLSSERIGRAVAQLDQSAQIEIESFEHFIEATSAISRACLCRGVSDKDFLLLPSLFRTSTNESPDLLEQKLMWVFKNHAMGILDRVPATEVEWLTVAQHHGLPTRLLDWSLSPLAAAFFAVESLSPAAGSVVLLELDKFSRAERIELQKLTEIVAFLPPHAARRVTAQSGAFTIHPSAQPLLDPSRLKQLVIPAKIKEDVKARLDKLGIHAGSMFPDLDGLARHLRYLHDF